MNINLIKLWETSGYLFIVYLLLCVCGHTTSGVVKTCMSKLVCWGTIGLKNILLGEIEIEMMHGS